MNLKQIDMFNISLSVISLTPLEVQFILKLEEGQFNELKDTEVSIQKLSKTISAFANADGGDLYIGISEDKNNNIRIWNGFGVQEDANAHLQVFEQYFPLGTDFQYDFLRSGNSNGLVLHLQVNKTRSIIRASNNIPYVRRGAQCLPVDTPEKIRQLEYTKGISSFEDEKTNIQADIITTSDVIKKFIRIVVPSAEPPIWLRKQQLIREDKPTVAGVLLFADEPQAIIPKRCGIKIYRYKTTELEGFREALAFEPETVEGSLYEQIKKAVKRTTYLVEGIQRMGEHGLESIKYPPETLHEIITNAVLHRDYSLADDIHIRIFDNRIEVQSPGKLPAHITIINILNERFARNGAIVRILNKFPDPPNKDIGEGLNTAFRAMHQLGLKEPIITEGENAVIVYIRHETLATAEETIMSYLEKHPTINNSKAREITHINADYKVKTIFGRMAESGMIEQVPGTRTSSTAYRKAHLQIQDQFPPLPDDEKN